MALLGGPQQLKIYERAAVRVDGRFVSQSTRVAVSFHSSDAITTFLGGGTKNRFALEPDTRLVKVDWTMVVPTTEADDLQFIKKYLDAEQVRLGVVMFGSRLAMDSKGWILAPSLGGSVGSSVEYSCGFIGAPGTFQ